MVNEYCFEHGLSLDDVYDVVELHEAQAAWAEFLRFVDECAG